MSDFTLGILDIESAIFAMDSWLDAFGEEPEWAEDAERVRLVAARMRTFIDQWKEKPERHLRLVKPDDEPN